MRGKSPAMVNSLLSQYSTSFSTIWTECAKMSLYKHEFIPARLQQMVNKWVEQIHKS